MAWMLPFLPCWSKGAKPRAVDVLWFGEQLIWRVLWPHTRPLSVLPRWFIGPQCTTVLDWSVLDWSVHGLLTQTIWELKTSEASQFTSSHESNGLDYIGLLPIGSMYAIYGNIYHQYTPNVSIYTIHGSYRLYCTNHPLFTAPIASFHVTSPPCHVIVSRCQGPTKTWRRRRRFGQSASGWSKRWRAFWRASADFTDFTDFTWVGRGVGKGVLSIPKKL